MIMCIKCKTNMEYFYTQGIYWIYRCPKCGAKRSRSDDCSEDMYNKLVSELKNNTDKYIMKCIKQGKIKVDCKRGEIYSVYKDRYYKQMINWAGYHYLDFKFFGIRKTVLVHRIVYLAHYTTIPKNYEIDHIDRNTHNNKISNLRAVNKKDNMKNRCLK